MAVRFNAHRPLLAKLARKGCIAVLTAHWTAVLVCAQGGASSDNVFRNTDPAVAYVGSKSCGLAGCHVEINHSYFAGPHGHSMAPANSPLELARVPKPVTVFNSKNNHYYTVFQDGADLYQGVYELDKNQHNIYSINHKLDYVVGGERTGYSYLYRIGKWIFQAPLSFYVPTKTWELSPGYAADDVGFTRVMTTSCLVCHNGQPDTEPKRDGMYKEQPFRFAELGVSCEACHGPGALHVREMQTKKGRVLGPHEVDTSIVNPAKLSPHLADDICRECHQTGDADVLYPGKSLLDFRPGTSLSEISAFIKRPIKEEQRAEANRLEANPPVRGSLEQPLWWKDSTLELSRCYQASHGRLTCSTCHSIHHLPKPEDEKAAYRAACLTCHKETSCSLKPTDSARVAAADYCVACHMEKRPVAGIAHSNDTKHRIVRYPGQPLPEIAFEQPRPDLPGLLWTNRPADKTGERLPDVMQLEAYFTVARMDPTLWPYWAGKLKQVSSTAPDDPQVLESSGVFALTQNKDYSKAAKDLSRALELGSEDPRSFLNLATALQRVGRRDDAEQVLQRGIAAYPYSGQLIAALAQQYFSAGKTWRAHSLLQRYRETFPEDATVRAVQNLIDESTNSGNPGLSQPK